MAGQAILAVEGGGESVLFANENFKEKIHMKTAMRRKTPRGLTGTRGDEKESILEMCKVELH
jgi:hypothetical protein